jgi:hypothetical protein
LYVQRNRKERNSEERSKREREREREISEKLSKNFVLFGRIEIGEMMSRKMNREKLIKMIKDKFILYI